MSRRMQIGALVLLFTLAIFAQTLGSLLAVEPAGAVSAQARFRGTVTRLMESEGLLYLSGTVELSGVTGAENPALLTSTSWDASVMLPYTVNTQGERSLKGTGQMRVRVVRPNLTAVVLDGRLSEIVTILAGYPVGSPFDFISVIEFVPPVDGGGGDGGGGDIDDFEQTAIASLETEFQLTNPWDMTDFMVTINHMETLYPVTNTPDIESPSTSPPTFMPPNS